MSRRPSRTRDHLGLAETSARHPSARGTKRIAKLIGLPGTPTRLAGGFVAVGVTEERLDERPREEADRLHAILAHWQAAHAPSAA